MSGHSHYANIKYQKSVADAKKGKIFSKLARVITIAVREKGPAVETNNKLKIAIEKAKEFNMPNDNIERAIKRGTGELEGEKLEEVIFEAYGPGGAAIIIEGITDNKNRTLGEIKQILSHNNGKLANEGSVRWMFERKGVIIINPKSQVDSLQKKDELELKIIESGAEDFYWRGDLVNVYAKTDELEKVKDALQKQGVKIESSSVDWAAKEEIDLPEKDKKSTEQLFDSLDENDSVQEIYSNLKE